MPVLAVLFLSCNLSFLHQQTEIQERLPLPDTHTHMHIAPWLHHYTGKEHPKQAHPNLTTRPAYKHTHIQGQTYTQPPCTRTRAHRHTHTGAHTQTHTHRRTQTRCPSNSFSQPFIWLHAQRLECFIFPCVWNWAAVQTDTQREKESERERHREREKGESGRKEWGATKRMRAAEREGRRGPAEKQEERCLDSFATGSPPKPYD